MTVHTVANNYDAFMTSENNCVMQLKVSKNLLGISLMLYGI